MGDRLRIVMIAAALALLSAPSYAEMTQTTARSDADKKSDAEADKAYKAMIKNVPDKARDTDPWKDMRGGDTASNNSAAGSSPASTNAADKKSAPSKHVSTKKPK
jgi:hypothetical protein